MTTATHYRRGKRMHQTSENHCIVSVTDRAYSRLLLVKGRFEFKNMAQVVDFLTRDIAKQQRAWARPEGV